MAIWQFNIDAFLFCGYSENIVCVHMAQNVCYPTCRLKPKNKRGRESFSLWLIHLSNFEKHYYYFIISDTYIFLYCYLYRHFHVNDYAFPYCRHYTSTLCSSLFIAHVSFFIKKTLNLISGMIKKSTSVYTYIHRTPGALFGQVIFIL